MRVRFQLTLHRFKEEFITTDEMRLLEIKFQLLRWVQVVQDNETV